jgi:hypothetical protein
MMNETIRRWLILAVILLLCVTGCTLFGDPQMEDYNRSASQQLWPSEEGFPQREIVFDVAKQEGVFGFIEPDGSGLITRTVALDLHAAVPTWGPGGEFITFRIGVWPYTAAYYQGVAQVVSAEGKMVGRCYGIWPEGSGRIWITSEDHLVTQFVYPDDEQIPDQIALVDFRSCKIVSILFEASSVESERLESGTLSSQGWLAMGRGKRENNVSTSAEVVVVVDSGTKEERVVGQGVAPAWSRDGEWLAFTGSDGIYVVRRDGTQLRRVVDLHVPPEEQDRYVWKSEMTAAAWSPDGEWLIYHRITPNGPTIFKTRVETGEEIEVFQGGMFPHWRWDMDDGGD